MLSVIITVIFKFLYYLGLLTMEINYKRNIFSNLLVYYYTHNLIILNKKIDYYHAVNKKRRTIVYDTPTVVLTLPGLTDLARLFSKIKI